VHGDADYDGGFFGIEDSQNPAAQTAVKFQTEDIVFFGEGYAELLAGLKCVDWNLEYFSHVVWA